MFKAPFGLGNPHLQTILSSVGPSRWLAHRAFAPYKSDEKSIVLECAGGVRLGGLLNRAKPLNTGLSENMAILIHGWEGSAESAYILSLAANLLKQGIDVFRLNLRDHGDTHHLNKGIFNSTLIPEVLSGIEVFQQEYPSRNCYLIGFSLGGNFSLRVAARAQSENICLNNVIAFCPVIHAARSNIVLNSFANVIYGKYFVRKWKRSLRKKLVYFPDYPYADELDTMKTLDEMNRQLIPIYTEYSDIDQYFDAYAITGDVLQETVCPCYLHFAKDDMIIPWEDVEQLADNSDLHTILTDKGGHCGYLKNWRFESWLNDRVLEIISDGRH